MSKVRGARYEIEGDELLLLNYKNLDAWNKSMELVVEVYNIVQKLPKTETYALGDQMRRAAVSIPSNIAEGQARHSDKYFSQFLYIARGSKAELETQIELAIRLNLIKKEDTAKATELLNAVGMMINGLLRSLKIN